MIAWLEGLVLVGVLFGVLFGIYYFREIIRQKAEAARRDRE